MVKNLVSTIAYNVLYNHDNRRNTHKHTGTTVMDIMKYYQDEYHQAWFKVEVALQKSIRKKETIINHLKSNSMKILSLFAATKEEKELKQAKLVARALKRGQEALLDSLEARRDAAQEVIDKLVIGKIGSINTATFNQTYHDAKLEIVLVDKEIAIAKAVQVDLYTNEK